MNLIIAQNDVDNKVYEVKPEMKPFENLTPGSSLIQKVNNLLHSVLCQKE